MNLLTVSEAGPDVGQVPEKGYPMARGQGIAMGKFELETFD
jgi:hypothetical protein